MSGSVAPAARQRLKVVHLVTLLELGGAQGNTIHTVRHLDSGRFDARLWCGRGGYWDKDVTADIGKSGRLKFLKHLVRPASPLHDLLAIAEIWNALRTEKPDIVHTHSSKAGIVGRIAAMLARVPVVIHTFHGFGFHNHQHPLVRWFYIAIERWTARFTDCLVFVSQSNWKIAQEARIGDPSRYLLIRSGVGLKRLAGIRAGLNRDQARRDLNIPTSAQVVITLSAFKPQKNLNDFIDMAATAAPLAPDALFVLVGDGELRPELETRVAQCGLQGRMLMPGWIKDPATALAAADVFVLTSLWEGLPRALVEALALGVPAVCYETDGVTDLLSDPEELRPKGDVAGLTGAVLALLTHPDAARLLAERQGVRVTVDFDIDEMVRQQERLYERLLGLKTR